MDTNPAAIAKRLSAFREKCTEGGLSLTPQRLAIYELLAADDSHLSAEDIFRRLKPNMPSLSRGTIYRTLELFEEQGLVSRLHALGDLALFEADMDPHHHLICVECRRVTDVHEPHLQTPTLSRKALGGFRVLSHRLHVMGVCPSCQSVTA
jgi:Fur family peroxide stress response transcriptional regulator